MSVDWPALMKHDARDLHRTSHEKNRRVRGELPLQRYQNHSFHMASRQF